MRSLALLSVLTAFMFSAGTWAQSQSTLLDQGIYAEDSLGDLDKAIELYEQILADAEANRVYAAQAQYRVGVCYAKKGLEKDAAAAFRKVVDRYPGQPTLVTQARARLTNLGLGTNGETLAMSTRQVWAPALDSMGAPSPDGRSMLVRSIQNDVMSLHWVDLKTGDYTTILQLPKGQGIGDYRLSKDGKRIYSLFDRSITALDLETGETEMLYRSKHDMGRWPFPVDSPPDGRLLAFVEFESETPPGEPSRRVMKILPTSGGEPIDLYTLVEDSELVGLAWMPNGDFAIIERSISEPDNPDKVLLFPAGGGDPRVSELQTERKIKGFVMNSDGHRIALRRVEPGGEQQIWVLENFLPASTVGK